MVNLPSPGTSRTRATASFRRPVARDSSATAIDSPLPLGGLVRAGPDALVARQWLRLLPLVGHRRALVDLQLRRPGPPAPALLQHAPEALRDVHRRPPPQHR